MKSKIFKIIIAISIVLSSIFMISFYDQIQDKVISRSDDDQEIIDQYIQEKLPAYLLYAYCSVTEIEDPSSLLQSEDQDLKNAFNLYVKSIDRYFAHNTDIVIECEYQNQKVSNVDFDQSKYLNKYTITFDKKGNATSTNLNVSNYYQLLDLPVDSIQDQLMYTNNNLTIDQIYSTYDEEVLPMDFIKDMKINIYIPSTISEWSELGQVLTSNNTETYFSIALPYILLIMGVLFIIVMLIPYRYITSKALEMLGSIKFLILSALWCSIFFPLGYGNIYLMKYSLKYGLEYFFTYFGIQNLSYEGMITINFIAWLIFFTLLFFVYYMIKYLFHKGVINYLKENTLIVWIYHTIFSILNRITKINFNQSGTQITSIFIVGNIIILVLCNFLSLIISTGYSSRVRTYTILMIIAFIFEGWYLYSRYAKAQKDYKIILDSTSELAKGRFHTEITQDVGIFDELKDEFNQIQYGFQEAVEEETKSNNMKTELITNVSHDLKTPLTSIISYIDLIKDPNIDDETRNNYIQVLDHNALRLKKLIQDLFDVSKANSGNLEVNKEMVDLVSFIKEVEFECKDQLEQKQIKVIYSNTTPLMIPVDIEKTYRIIENLLINVSKYALENTRVFIDFNDTTVTIKNISKDELSFDENHIMERFVQGDSSRNTQGSGLGLAIVKSFMEVQGGTFHIETDGDLFKAILTFSKE